MHHLQHIPPPQRTAPITHNFVVNRQGTVAPVLHAPEAGYSKSWNYSRVQHSRSIQIKPHAGFLNEAAAPSASQATPCASQAARILTLPPTDVQTIDFTTHHGVGAANMGCGR